MNSIMFPSSRYSSFFQIHIPNYSLSSIIISVAFSSWCNTFIDVYKKHRKNVAGQFNQREYRIAIKLRPKKSQNVQTLAASGDYFSFMAVRHPLDRLLSAYRDRILDVTSGQAVGHVPQMYKKFNINNR